MIYIAVVLSVLANVLCASVENKLNLILNDEQNSAEWWKSALIYQIYPLSFKDSNGDGIGDINGILEKMEYLQYMGVDGVWLSPIYASPLADGGYDISNHTEIDPRFGTLHDLSKLRDALHNSSMKLILDFVPNHTSKQHKWFAKSVRREGKYADYYVWRDGRTIKYNDTLNVTIPPTNWRSFFGGSAWTYEESRGQYYLHQFLEEQPDLNYWNEEVVNEMKGVLKYWMDFGVDGFRMDAVDVIAENNTYSDEPFLDPEDSKVPLDSLTYAQLNHIYTIHQDKTFEILESFKKFINDSNMLIVTETWAATDIAVKYYGSMGMPFNFNLISGASETSNAEEMHRIISTYLAKVPQGKWMNWVTGNHDSRRMASRYGPELVEALMMVNLMLPGTAFAYAGDEIGMVDTVIRKDQTKDPWTKNNRDGARTPMQWDDTPNAGFSTNKSTWLPVNPNYYWLNVRSQKNAPVSRNHLNVFTRLSALRKDPNFVLKNYTLYTTKQNIYIIKRVLSEVTYIAVINFGDIVEDVTLDNSVIDSNQVMVVYACSGNSEYDFNDLLEFNEKYPAPRPKPFSMRPKSAVLLATIPETPAPLSAGSINSYSVIASVLGAIVPYAFNSYLALPL